MSAAFDTFFSLFTTKSLAIPMWEFVLFVVIASVSMIAGKHKAGIILAYLFLFYWIFVAHRTTIMGYIGDSTVQVFVYAVSGAVMIAVTIMAFFIESR